jgi:hypothetical protein
MWLGMGLARGDVSEEYIAYIFRVERISKLGTLVITGKVTASVEE